MKKCVNQNKQNLLDWWLSIDFDPAQMPRIKPDSSIISTFLLDEKTIEQRAMVDMTLRNCDDCSQENE